MQAGTGNDHRPALALNSVNRGSQEMIEHQPAFHLNGVGLQIHIGGQQADGFAVACIKEAGALREAEIQQPVTVFQGFQTAEQLQLCIKYQLDTDLS